MLHPHAGSPRRVPEAGTCAGSSQGQGVWGAGGVNLHKILTFCAALGSGPFSIYRVLLHSCALLLKGHCQADEVMPGGWEEGQDLRGQERHCQGTV